MSPLLEAPSANKMKHLIWPLVAISILTVAGYVWLDVLGCGLIYPWSGESLTGVGFILNGIGFAVLGGLLLRNRPANRIGWLAAAIGALQFVPLVAAYSRCGLSGNVGLPLIPYAAWVTDILGTLYFFLLFILLPLIFPNGRFLSQGWRRLALLATGIFLAATLGKGFLPSELGPTLGVTYPRNPLAISWLPSNLLPHTIRILPFPAMILLAILSMVLRWRRATGDERQQLKWFAYFLSTAVFINIVFFQVLSSLWYPWITDTLWYGLMLILNFAGFPAVIGIAIFKYRLYDIDLVIRRTLSYALLTGVLGLVYFGGVVLLQSIFRALSGNPASQVVTVISTLAIAALFNPLRERLQNFIDSRYHRREYKYDRVVSRFARAARDEVSLDRLSTTLVTVVKETIQPASSELWLMEGTGDRGKREA